MEYLRPNDQRARNATILIWLVLVMEILSLLSSYLQYTLLVSASNGTDISPEAASSNDSREQIIGIFSLAVLIISAVTFTSWFRRAYYNLHQRVNNLAFTEGWATGSWFVPVLNLFRPYQIMKELYEETRNLFQRKGVMLAEDLSTKYLGWWWALWIINNILGQIAFRTSMKADTINELISSTILNMTTNVINIPLAFLAMRIIRDYANVEHLLNEIGPDAEGEVVPVESEPV
jgi:hypothetical protein